MAKVTLKSIEAEVDLKELNLPRVIHIDPDSLLAEMARSITQHSNNALSHPKDSYMRGYHEGAAQRIAMLRDSIRNSIQEKAYSLNVHSLRGAILEVILATEF